MKTSRPTGAFKKLAALRTERRNPQTMNIDLLDVRSILMKINDEDQSVAVSVRQQIRNISRAVNLIVKALKKGGRLIYIGAGTSGRLGLLDAAECPPTYGTDPSLVQAYIAGGRAAVFRSVEGAEDLRAEGQRVIRRARVGSRDVVCGIAASSRTPFVLAGIAEAWKRGAKTIFVTTNPKEVLTQSLPTAIRRKMDVVISPDVGPEVIMGSTRMKSGTAQKLVLNMLSTAAMIRLGKVYENMMVDLRLNSSKLRERAKRILMLTSGLSYREASRLLVESSGQVKTAIVMAQRGVTASAARRILAANDGFTRKAIPQNRTS